MPVTSVSDVSALSKVLYPKGYDPKTLYRNKPLLNDIKKKKDFTSGRGMEIPTDYQLTSGIGSTVAGAVENANPSKAVAFTVPQSEIDGYVYIDRRAWMNALMGDDLSKFIDYGRKQTDDGMESLMQELHRQAYGTRGGSRGTISAASGTTFTMTNASDTAFLRIGMIVQMSATDGGALRAGTPGYATIDGINPTTGVVNVTGTITTLITSPTAGDHVFQKNLAYNNGTGAECFHGLAGWCPATVTDGFCGVTRTVSPSMLAGVRYADTSGNLETLFIKARAQAFTEVGSGFSMGTIYLHPLQFASFVSTKEGAKPVDEKLYDMGINKVRLGGFTFCEDWAAPLLTAFCVGDGAFELSTCGDQPTMGKAWDDPDVGQIKIPLYVYGNFLARKVSQIMRITLPAVT